MVARGAALTKDYERKAYTRRDAHRGGADPAHTQTASESKTNPTVQDLSIRAQEAKPMRLTHR